MKSLDLGSVPDGHYLIQSEYRVSVVIPTIRPGYIIDAVTSVLEQSYQAHEVIVVFDGTTQDPNFFEIRRSLPTSIKLLATGGRTNANCARNLGSSSASGNYIALLDDDDVWLPEKLERQVNLLRKRGNRRPKLVACQVQTMGTQQAQTWPATKPPEDGPIGNFLLRYKPSAGPNYIQTSTWLLPAYVLRDRPFDETVSIHQDLDWLIRLGSLEPDWLLFVCEPLVRYRVIDTTSVSRSSKWQASRTWVTNSSLPIERKCRGDFLLVNVLPKALTDSWPAGGRVAFEAIFKYRAHLGAVLYAMRHVAIKTAARVIKGLP